MINDDDDDDDGVVYDVLVKVRNTTEYASITLQAYFSASLRQVRSI